jgi:hypothetical protein
MNMILGESSTLINKSKKRMDQVKSTYDAVFNILKRETLTLPQSMNRDTTNGSLKLFLVKNSLIKEINLKDNLNRAYLSYRY